MRYTNTLAKFKEKKAQGPAEKSLYYLIAGFVFTVIFLLFSFIVNSEGMAQTIMPNGLETYILIQRFLNSQDCFIYYDKETARAYPRLIDWDRFSNEALEKCYRVYDSKVKGFRLTLLNLDLMSQKTITTKNWEGYVSEVKKEKNIRIYKNGVMSRGELKIEVQKR